MKDKRFDLHTHQSEHMAFYKVTGKDSEKESLKKFLTLINKSVQYQLIKTADLLKFWQERESYLANIDRTDNAVEAKVAYYRELYKELKSQAIVRYFEEVDKELYVPKGFWYLFSNAVSDMDNTIEPVCIEKSRNYQVDAVKAMMKHKRSIGNIATGGGKSLIILNLCLSYVKAGKRVMILVPSDYLVGQVMETVKPYHENTTAAGGGRQPKLGADIFITTVQSAKQYVDVFDVLIWDELHHASSKTWQAIMAEANAEYVHGLTATAFRGGDQLHLGLNAFAGPISYVKSVRELIQEGYLLEPDVYSVELSGSAISDSKMATTAYKTIASSPKVLQYIRNQVLKALSSGRKCIVVFKTIDPANKLKKLMKDDGISFNIATGTFKDPLYKFKEGKCPILVASASLIGEGLDFPLADLLIVATQHVSDITTFQVTGRVMRLHPDKKKPILIDIVFGNYSQFQRAIEKRKVVYKEISNNITYVKG